jgi:transcriptional regulator with PAS, ATPase and Fis domain
MDLNKESATHFSKYKESYIKFRRNKRFNIINSRRYIEILKILIAQSFAAVAIFDKYFNYIIVNNNYAERCGHNISDLTGYNHFDLFPSDEIQEIFKKVILTKQANEFNSHYIFPNQLEQEVNNWQWKLIPVLNAKGLVDLLALTSIEREKESEIFGRITSFNDVNIVGEKYLHASSVVDTTEKKKIERVFHLYEE